ncbi:DUF91 domain-containing protein [bacterium]|nr:DUF91 domain-containing protein [bacterium]
MADLKEKDMQYLIAKYPDEFIEDGLEIISTEYNVNRKRIDILFRDKYGRLLVIELKKGTLSREAIGQIIEYYGLLKDEKSGDNIEMMVIANNIPPERKEYLAKIGIELREISINKFISVAKKHGLKLEDYQYDTDIKKNDIRNVDYLPSVPKIYTWEMTVKVLKKIDLNYNGVKSKSIYNEFVKMFPQYSTKSKESFNADLNYHCINMRSRFPDPRNKRIKCAWQNNPLFYRISKGFYRLLKDDEKKLFKKALELNLPIIYEEEYTIKELLEALKP